MQRSKNIYIYCDPQTDYFIVSQLFSVVRAARCFKAGIKRQLTLCQLDSLAQSHHHSQHNIYMLYFDLRPGPKMLFQGDTPEGSDTFQWPVIKRDRVGGLRLKIWDKVKVPSCHYSDAPEESNHDSYFRLMTIKHSISKIQWAIVWALNYYIIELSWVPKQLPVEFQTARDQMW